MVTLTGLERGTSPVRHRGRGHGWEASGAMAQARKVATYILTIFVLYTIITSPARAADLVQVGFQGISNAARGIGQFMTQLVN